MKIKRLYSLTGILVIVCSFASLTAPAQDASSRDDFTVQVWDTDSGLPQSTVTGIVQMSDGYIWIGTLLGGLARFDGSHFVDFYPGNAPELKSIEIQKLLADGDGTLWIGGYGGSVDSYKHGKFHLEFENGEIPRNWLEEVVSPPGKSIILSSLSGMLFSREGMSSTNKWQTFRLPDFGRDPCENLDRTIWYRTSKGHLAKIIEGKKVALESPPGLRSPIINKLLKDNQGRLWVGTEKEIAVWNGEKFVDMNPTNGEPDFTVRDLAFCPDGSLWVRTDDKLRKCTNQRWLAEADPWNGQFPFSTRPPHIFGDNQGGVWVIHYGMGLWHVDNAGHVSRVGKQQGLPNGLVECWCEDHEGNFWVGLRDGGLACVRPKIFHAVGFPAGWTNKSMRSICEDDDGAMWFGMAGPIILRWFDNEFTSFSPQAEPIPGTETAVLPDGPGQLWVGAVRNGLWQLKQGKFIRPFPSDNIGTVARCLYLDHTGALWIGSEYGLYRWEKGKLKRFTPADIFSPACVSSITEDRTGDIWVGTAVGELRRWHNGKFESFRPPDMMSGTVISQSVMTAEQTSIYQSFGGLFGRECFWALHFDSAGVLWIGTLGGGLLRFENGSFTRFTTKDGLPSEHVSQILEDDRGCLWLGTRAGISRVDKQALNNRAKGANDTINFINYGKNDDLPSIECSGGIQPACWKSRDGRLWFLTAKGPVWVDPATLHFNRLSPPVHLEEFLVDNEPIPSSLLDDAQEGNSPSNQIRIAPGRHYFDFKFTALSFSSPGKVKFKWRLKGLEANWVEGGTPRDASYSFLQAGNYRFEVQACNNDGVWNQTGAAIDFIVLPFFWQEWWFKLAVILLIAGVLLVIYSVRIARLRGLERLRLRIARDLHDEVGANLGSLSLLGQMIEQSPSKANGVKVSVIAMQTIETLRDIIWFIDPAHGRLSDLVARLQETARVMLPTLDFTFTQTGNFGSVDLPLTFRRNVPSVFKEALHNLLKYSQATKVEIMVNHLEKEFQFQIRDNGVGFETGRKSSGNGLKNMRRRAVEIGGRIEIESGVGCGTVITLTAPITQTRSWWPSKK